MILNRSLLAAVFLCKKEGCPLPDSLVLGCGDKDMNGDAECRPEKI